MSCLPCDTADKDLGMAYVRVGKANVGLIGCDEHLKELLEKMDGRKREVIVRVKPQEV